MRLVGGTIESFWWSKLINWLLWPTRWVYIQDICDDKWYIVNSKNSSYQTYNYKNKENARPCDRFLDDIFDKGKCSLDF